MLHEFILCTIQKTKIKLFMKNRILLLLLISTSASFAQRIKFTYDSAGNQTQRAICFCAAKMATDSVYKTPETITENDMIEDAVYEQISYYPNPVREELYVKWKNQDSAYVTSIEIFSMSGQLIKSYPNLNNVEKASIAFQNFPEGVYNLILLYSNSERKTLKVIKK